MKSGEHSVSRRSMLRTVGTGLAVGSIGSVSGCLGQAEPEPEPDSREIEEGYIEVEDGDEEPSSDSSLAGSATGEPSGIRSHNMGYRGRYDANNYKPYLNYQTDFIYIYNRSGYLANIQVFPGDMRAGEPTYDQNISLGNYAGFPRSGDIRVNVVGSDQFLLISPDVKNVEIWLDGVWMGGIHQREGSLGPHFWVGDF